MKKLPFYKCPLSVIDILNQDALLAWNANKLTLKDVGDYWDRMDADEQYHRIGQKIVGVDSSLIVLKRARLEMESE
jgi:hypothetical protein